jgi:hypothetical protein
MTTSLLADDVIISITPSCCPDRPNRKLTARGVRSTLPVRHSRELVPWVILTNVDSPTPQSWGEHDVSRLRLPRVGFDLYESRSSGPLHQGRICRDEEWT